MTEKNPPDDPNSTANDSASGDSGISRPNSGPRLISENQFSAREEDFNGANDEAMAIRLSMLEEEHRDLDAAISAMEQNAPYERLSIARLKKKKLILKDKIQELKDAMLPDIIA